MRKKQPETVAGQDPPPYLKALNPLWFIGLAFVLSTLPALLSTPGQRASWQQVWILSTQDIVLLVLGFAGLAAGAYFAIRHGGPAVSGLQISAQQIRRLKTFARVLFIITLTAYVLWFVSAVAHGFTPAAMWGILTGQPGVSFSARESFVTIPGVTTLTQAGPMAIAAYVLLWRLGIRHPVVIGLLFALSLARLAGNSERLAFLELLVPALIVVALVPGRHRHRARKALPAGAYFAIWTTVGLSGLLALFAVSERTRSFTENAGESTGLLSYSADRMLAYYGTATNNGAHYYHHVAPQLALPEQAFEWLWQFPFAGNLLRTLFAGQAPGVSTVWPEYLTAHNNPELNSPSSILPLYAELGFVLATVLLIAGGIALGRIYRSASRGSVTGVLVYSVLIVGILELPRFFYFGLGRAFPVILTCVAAKFVFAPPPWFATVQAKYGPRLTSLARHLPRIHWPSKPAR